MPYKGYRSLTVNEKTYDMLGLANKDVQKYMNEILIEKEKLHIFSSKIKKYPLTIQTYTNPFKRERRTRNG